MSLMANARPLMGLETRKDRSRFPSEMSLMANARPLMVLETRMCPGMASVDIMGQMDEPGLDTRCDPSPIGYPSWIRYAELDPTMLNRVQREYLSQQSSTSPPISLYQTKRNSVVVLNKDTGVPQIVIQKNANGFDLSNVQTFNNTSAYTKRKILAMLQEVNNKRTIRECRQSDEELGSVLGMHTYFNQKTKNYKQKYMVYNFLNYPKARLCFGSPTLPIPVRESHNHMVFGGIHNPDVVVELQKPIPGLVTSRHVGALRFLYLLEKVIIIWFSGEFIIRMWSSSCKNQYQGWSGKIKYLSVPSRLMDVIVITLSLVVLTINPSSGHEVFAASAFRGFHRFFQVLQILTLNKQLQPWKVLSSVIYDQREQLFIIFYIEFIVLCILAYISYIVEKDENHQFDSIAEAMWWALVTLSTVGYGDKVPMTWLGKLISSLFTVLGVAIFALPAGIIGTGLALKVEEEERNQQRKKKKVAAAILIQCMWRCYKANANYVAVSSFFKHKPMDLFKKHDYENIANKFVRLTKFFIAKQRFKELLRPLDIKNVLQSYKDGQLDVMNKVKLIQRSVDSIVRKIGANESRIYGANTCLERKIERLEVTLMAIIARVDSQLPVMEGISRRLIRSEQFVDYVLDSQSSGTATDGRQSCSNFVNNTNSYSNNKFCDNSMSLRRNSV
ncbi:unnamed protein product [Oppiella nova]|uniref:Uncharacterized protein n=1 Tax=Oppiella nova TaxID=334625 RepID=A0A7R9QCG4_9ACAR|nr:unnamed protein product [Oppiella nova]CAG2162981.1 unnamed protein product [Oppiella nova]